MEESEQIEAATAHLVHQFTEVVTKMGPDLCRSFGIDGRQLNFALARAGIGIAAMAALSNYDRPVDDASELAEMIEELISRTIEEG